MNAKYYLGAAVSLPLLPIMVWQGKQIRKSVPTLPEATQPKGMVQSSSNREIQLITIGESTIAGVGVSTHQEGFTGTLAQTLSEQEKAKVHWCVYARSGYTARLVAQRLIPKIEETHANLIVVGLGGNDAFTLNSPQKWQVHIKQLLNTIREKFPDTPIVFTNMPPIKSFPAFTPLIKFTVGNLVEILGEALEAVVAQHENVYYYSKKITLKDWIERFQVNLQPTDFFSDGVHPAKITYQLWAKDMANFIQENVMISKFI